MKENLLIFREELLPPSETFILSQGESLEQFRPIYMGLRRVQGLEIPTERCELVGGGRGARLRRARLKLIGVPTRSLDRVRALRPVLLHAHFGMDATTAMSVAASLRIPLIVTFHGWDATVRDDVFCRQSIALNLYVWRRRVLARKAARVLCVSEFIRSEVLKKGFPDDRTKVHYIGIDRNKFASQSPARRGRIVLFAGRLVEVKGAEFVIRAMEIVQSRIKDAELVVLGDGPLRRQLELHAHSCLRSCRFLGHRAPSEVREWMDKARVFCVPSIAANAGNTEAFGIVFAESQAMGLPVASFASGGIPEAVEHGVTGLLAPERDVDALARNISTLLTDDSMWRRFSESGQERVRRCFDLKKQTVRLEEIYQEVLSEHRAGVSYS